MTTQITQTPTADTTPRHASEIPAIVPVWGAQITDAKGDPATTAEAAQEIALLAGFSVVIDADCQDPAGGWWGVEAAFDPTDAEDAINAHHEEGDDARFRAERDGHGTQAQRTLGWVEIPADAR